MSWSIWRRDKLHALLEIVYDRYPLPYKFRNSDAPPRWKEVREAITWPVWSNEAQAGPERGTGHDPIKKPGVRISVSCSLCERAWMQGTKTGIAKNESEEIGQPTPGGLTRRLQLNVEQSRSLKFERRNGGPNSAAHSLDLAHRRIQALRRWPLIGILLQKTKAHSWVHGVGS